MKNILIIGGSYFIGRVFVEELQNHSEYAVHVLNRGNRTLNMPGVQEILCDRHDTDTLSRVVPPLDWDAVVDFCAYEPGDIAELLMNLPGSVRHYIYISTATVYRDSLTLPMKEDALKLEGPLPGPNGDYAYKKWLAELKLEELCRERDITYVCLRPAFVYGKYNYAPRESYFFNIIAKDETIILPSSPQALFSMVSVWDLAGICIACLGNEKVFDNAYNVCAEELISYDRLIEVLETITGRKFNVRRQPVRMIEAQNIPLPFPLEEHLVYSGSLLQQTLNYEYMSFDEGMTRTYNWYFKIDS
ncbi:NAD-dependent epimerase/dehydratase family protein [Chloroflexota bacterium]